MAEIQKTEIEKIPEKTKKRKALIIGIAAGASAIILLYFFGALYFNSHFFPKTFINGKDCSMMTAVQAASLLRKDIEDYSLTLLDREGNEAAVISSGQVDLEMDIEGQTQLLRSGQNVFLWFIMIFTTDSHEFPYDLSFNGDKLKSALKETTLFDKNKVIKPEDAYISEYSEGTGYEIIPEKEGTLIDEEALFAACGNAFETMQESLSLKEAGCYAQAEVKQDDEMLQRLCREKNLLAASCITYDWNGFEEIVDGSVIKDWILQEEGRVFLDEEKVRDFVEEKASEHDTYGRKRNFLTTQGVELTLQRGGYGWKVDREAETQELLRLIKEGSVTDREPVYTVTAYHKGEDDIGASYVEIDLTNQHLYLYIDGQIVLETDFVSGDVSQGNTTPPGIFGITYKTRNAVLRGETYETPVSYWMPYNGNIGMHDADWRRKFGGDIYLTNGSHGCVNLPVAQAAKIYEYMKQGFPIVSYYY